jgi:hypothetical protein
MDDFAAFEAVYKELPEEVRKEYAKRDFVFNELAEESDRHAAIIGGAIVDEAMERFLKSRMRQGIETDRLFDYPRPLSTASAKIELAYAMEFIGPCHYTDLRYINDIRNTFAHETLLPDAKHQLSKLTFDSQKVRDLCGNLLHAKAIVAKGITMEPRMRFIVTVIIMTIGLTNAWVNPGSGYAIQALKS